MQSYISLQAKHNFHLNGAQSFAPYSLQFSNSER